MPKTVDVQPGQDVRVIYNAAGEGDEIRLKCGSVYEMKYSLGPRANKVKLTSFGTGPRPVLRWSNGNMAGVTLNYLSAIFDGIALVNTGVPTKCGIEAYAHKGLTINNCEITGFRMGFWSQSNEAALCGEVWATNNYIHDNWQGTKDGHSAGCYISRTNGVHILNNIFNHNGWREGKQAPTVYNHEVYMHEENVGVIEVRGNVFANASATGVQARSGGDITDNLFMDNPVHITAGYVNGANGKPGGVTFNIEHNVFSGMGGLIDGVPRGWCINVHNVKDGRIVNNIVANGTLSPALRLESGAPYNPGQLVGVESLVIDKLWLISYAPGAYKINNLDPTGKGMNHLGKLTLGTLGPPKTLANPKTVLPANFLATAALDPVSAGRKVVMACFVAAGVEAGPSPTPTPTPTPPPPPVGLVTALVLYDADTDKPILTLVNGMTVNLQTLATRNLSLVAETDGNPIGSVKMGVNSVWRVENSAPFAFAGDKSGDLQRWDPPQGGVILAAQAFAQPNASGTGSASLTVSVSIIDQPAMTLQEAAETALGRVLDAAGASMAVDVKTVRDYFLKP